MAAPSEPTALHRLLNADQRPEAEAVLIRVRGAVQGVGFRPFVHALASRCGLVFRPTRPASQR